MNRDIFEQPLFVNTAKVLNTIGEKTDQLAGIPGRLATGLNPAVPKGFSQQVGQATQAITGSPTAGAVAGLGAGFLLPGGKKFHPQDAKFLVKAAETIKSGTLLKPSQWQIFQGTLKNYGFNTPTTQKRASDFILTAKESADTKVLETGIKKRLNFLQDKKTGRFYGSRR